MPTASVRATFTFDPQQHYRASREVLKRTSARYTSWIGILVAALLLYSNVLRHWGEFPIRELAWSAIPWVLLAVFWAAIVPLSTWRTSRRIAKSDPAAQGLQIREVDESGVRSTGNNVTVHVPWAALLKSVETEEFFLFFYSKQLAYYMPKSILDTSDVETVRLTLRKHLAGKAQLASN
jgi:hypothetical protein